MTTQGYTESQPDRTTVWVHETRDDWVLDVYATLDAAVRDLVLTDYEVVEDDGRREVVSAQLGHAVLTEIEVKP